MLHSSGDYLSRYLYVFDGLLSNFEIKFVLGVVAVFTISVIEAVTGLFLTEIHLIAAVCILVAVDAVTGVTRSYVENGISSLSSFGFRNTFIKVIEYILVLGSLTVISNMHPSLEWVRTWAYVFVALTEFWSIGENMYSEKVRLLVQNFLEVHKTRLGTTATVKKTGEITKKFNVTDKLDIKVDIDPTAEAPRITRITRTSTEGNVE